MNKYLIIIFIIMAIANAIALETVIMDYSNLNYDSIDGNVYDYTQGCRCECEEEIYGF